MEVVRPSYDRRTSLYDFIAIACIEAGTILGIWLKSYDVVRRPTIMAQHYENAMRLWTCGMNSRDIAWRRGMSRDDHTCTIPYNLGNRIQVFNMTKNRQGVVRGSPMASTSYNVSRLCTIHPRWSTILKNFTHLTWSYDILKAGVTIA